jgi:hypothetical protein
MSDDQYTHWISEHYPTTESASLQCAEATLALVRAFPELRRVRGHAMVGVNLRSHWWCVTPSGDVIDPTAHQWTTVPVFYEPLPDDAKEPHGRCLHCGDLLFRSNGAGAFFCENCNPRKEGA